MTRLLNRDPIEPSRLGRWLRDLANQVEARDPSDPKGPRPFGTEQLREALREHLRARESLFGPDLFADPAWDLLLDLLLSDLDRRTVSISSACLAAAVPSTTALRWISLLEKRDLVRRVANPADRRSSYLILASGTRDALIGWCRQYLLNDLMEGGIAGAS